MTADPRKRRIPGRWLLAMTWRKSAPPAITPELIDVHVRNLDDPRVAVYANTNLPPPETPSGGGRHTDDRTVELGLEVEITEDVKPLPDGTSVDIGKTYRLRGCQRRWPS